MIWMNGRLCEAEGAISAQDRGVLLGESLFETLLVKNAVPQFWDAHVERLTAACAAFELPLAYTGQDLRDGAAALIKKERPPARAVLRLTVTGGNGGRGLIGTKDGHKSNLIMQLSPAAAPPSGFILADCDVLRFAGQTASQHKTGAYMDNILARKQALKAGADEAVMRNQYGRIACAAAGNIFAVFGRMLITPPISEGALPGIIRHALLSESQLGGFEIVEGLLEAERLREADALFITNSVNGVVAAAYDTPSAAQKKQGLALNEALPEFSDF